MIMNIAFLHLRLDSSSKILSSSKNIPFRLTRHWFGTQHSLLGARCFKFRTMLFKTILICFLPCTANRDNLPRFFLASLCLFLQISAFCIEVFPAPCADAPVTALYQIRYNGLPGRLHFPAAPGIGLRPLVRFDLSSAVRRQLPEAGSILHNSIAMLDGCFQLSNARLV